MAVFGCKCHDLPGARREVIRLQRFNSVGRSRYDFLCDCLGIRPLLFDNPHPNTLAWQCIPHKYLTAICQFAHALPEYLGEVAIALAPIAAFFAGSLLMILHLPRREVLRIAAGLLYTYVGLALFLTLFIMQPVANTIYTEAYLPLARAEISFEEAAGRAAVPLKRFMLNQAREPDLDLFVSLAGLAPVATPDELPLRVVVPAFVTSELKTAFQIGFIIFIPFLVIDLVVASVLMSMGMMMMSPILIALPFKIILFVLVDGWTLLVGSLVQSFVP